MKINSAQADKVPAGRSYTYARASGRDGPRVGTRAAGGRALDIFSSKKRPRGARGLSRPAGMRRKNEPPSPGVMKRRRPLCPRILRPSLIVFAGTDAEWTHPRRSRCAGVGDAWMLRCGASRRREKFGSRGFVYLRIGEIRNAEESDSLGN